MEAPDGDSVEESFDDSSFVVEFDEDSAAADFVMESPIDVSVDQLVEKVGLQKLH